MVNIHPIRLALKAVGKNYENMSSKIHNFSTMQNIRIQYKLYEMLHESKTMKAVTLLANLPKG